MTNSTLGVHNDSNEPIEWTSSSKCLCVVTPKVRTLVFYNCLRHSLRRGRRRKKKKKMRGGFDGKHIVETS